MKMGSNQRLFWLFAVSTVLVCQGPSDPQPSAQLRELTPGTLLFMGKIVEPVWEEG